MKLARALASRPIRALTGVNICWLDLLPPATQEKLIAHTRVLANMYELGISSDRGWMFCNTHVCTVFYKNFDRLVDRNLYAQEGAARRRNQGGDRASAPTLLWRCLRGLWSLEGVLSPLSLQARQATARAGTKRRESWLP